MKDATLLNFVVVVGQLSAVLQLLATKDQTLLVRGDALLVLAEGSERRRDASVARPHISSLAQQRHSTPHHNAHLRLHVVNRVRRLHIKRDGLARQRLHKDLHATTQAQHQVQCALLLTVGQGAATQGGTRVATRSSAPAQDARTCCSQKACGRPPAACPQRSNAAGQGGCPPCLG